MCVQGSHRGRRRPWDGVVVAWHHGQAIEGSMMAVESRMVALGQVIPDFTLKSVQGDLISLDDFVEAPALLVAFLCNHCPYVRHVEKKLGSVLAGLPDLAVLGVCSNDVEAYPDDAPPNLLEQARRAGWNFPYLVDEDQDVARAFG